MASFPRKSEMDSSGRTWRSFAPWASAVTISISTSFSIVITASATILRLQCLDSISTTSTLLAYLLLIIIKSEKMTIISII